MTMMMMIVVTDIVGVEQSKRLAVRTERAQRPASLVVLRQQTDLVLVGWLLLPQGISHCHQAGSYL